MIFLLLLLAAGWYAQIAFLCGRSWWGIWAPVGAIAYLICLKVIGASVAIVWAIPNPDHLLLVQCGAFVLSAAYGTLIIWRISFLIHTLLIGAAIAAILPFIWILCAAFKRQEDIFTFVFLPDDLGRLTLDNIRTLFTRIPFARWLFNSCFLASTQTVIVVTLSSLGGFALAKYRFRGRRTLMLVMLGTMLLPSQVLLPSMYELVYHLGWMNSYFAILFPGAVSVFGMFLFKQAMSGVPDELLQAGRVDGCSELRLWWEIALPVVRPMVGAFTLLAFLSSWNSFLWPQIILQDESKYTLPIGLTNMMGLPGFDTEYGALMAGALLSILPVVILFFVLQRDFIAGLTSGAVKG